MTPDAFIAKWRASALTERAAAQPHFIDLCRLLDEPTPAEADPDGRAYAFEKGATKTAGGRGWADVWKRGHFALEYKRRGSTCAPPSTSSSATPSAWRTCRCSRCATSTASSSARASRATGISPMIGTK